MDFRVKKNFGLVIKYFKCIQKTSGDFNREKTREESCYENKGRQQKESIWPEKGTRDH